MDIADAIAQFYDNSVLTSYQFKPDGKESVVSILADRVTQDDVDDMYAKPSEIGNILNLTINANSRYLSISREISNISRKPKAQVISEAEEIIKEVK